MEILKPIDFLFCKFGGLLMQFCGNRFSKSPCSFLYSKLALFFHIFVTLLAAFDRFWCVDFFFSFFEESSVVRTALKRPEEHLERFFLKKFQFFFWFWAEPFRRVLWKLHSTCSEEYSEQIILNIVQLTLPELANLEEKSLHTERMIFLS